MMSLSQLAIYFFHFYGNVFDWTKCVVSIKSGLSGAFFKKPPRAGRDHRPGSWQIRDCFDADCNMSMHTTVFTRYFMVESFKAAAWTLVTFEDWKRLFPPTGTEAYLRRPFLRFEIRQSDNLPGMSWQILRLFERMGHHPKQVFRPLSVPYTSRQTFYIQFNSTEDANRAISCNEFLIPVTPSGLAWRCTLNLSCGFELQSHLIRYRVLKNSSAFIDSSAMTVEASFPRLRQPFVETYLWYTHTHQCHIISSEVSRLPCPKEPHPTEQECEDYCNQEDILFSGYKCLVACDTYE